MASVKVRVAGEHFNLSLKRKAGKDRLYVSGNVSKIKKDTDDKVEMLSIIRHYEQYGIVVDGDINQLRAKVLGEESTLSSLDNLTPDTGLLLLS